jgi:hypothetical protein
MWKVPHGVNRSGIEQRKQDKRSARMPTIVIAESNNMQRVAKAKLWAENQPVHRVSLSEEITSL